MTRSRKRLISRKIRKQVPSGKKKGIWVSDCPPMTRADAEVLVHSMNCPGELTAHMRESWNKYRSFINA